MRSSRSICFTTFAIIMLVAGQGGCYGDDCERKLTCVKSGATTSGSGGGTGAAGGAGTGGGGGGVDTCGNGVVDVGEICFDGTVTEFATGVAHVGVDLAIADCDGDGDNDVIVLGAAADAGAGSVSALVNDGNGDLGGVIPKVFNYGRPSQFTMGNFFLDSASLFIGFSDNHFVDHWNHVGCDYSIGFALYPSASGNTASIITADLNGDNNDGFVGLRAVATDALMWHDTTDTMAPISELNPGSGISSLASGRLDSDVADDIVLVRSATSQFIVRLSSNGAVSTTIAGSFSMGMVPADVALGDINNDGNLDIISANSGDGTISVAIGNGTGNFTVLLPATPSTSDALCLVAVGDLNSDGSDDVVVVDCDNQNVSQVHVYLSDNGQLTHSYTYSVAGNASGVAIVRLNSDELPDIVTSHALVANNTSKISVALQSP